VVPRLPRRALLGLALKAPFLAVACTATTADTGLPTAEPGVDGLTATTATPIPPTSTPVPPTPTAVPPTLQASPPQIQQGGVAMVVLNQPASSGTVRFNGLQYPLVQKGDRWWTIVGVGAFAELGPYGLNVSYSSPSGAATASGTLTVLDKDYPVENIVLDAQTSALLAPEIVSNELARRAAIYGVFTPQKLWSGPWLRPHPAELSDIYGIARGYNGSPPTDYHRGTDFAGQKGTPIVSAAAGKVAFAGALQVRGNSVIVDHGVGVFTAYHHLSRIDMATGDAVAAGQQVGLLGDTGLVTGPHLHWEVVVRGIEVDGLLWLDGHEWGL
jgi:hypothetical protein